MVAEILSMLGWYAQHDATGLYFLVTVCTAAGAKALDNLKTRR